MTGDYSFLIVVSYFGLLTKFLVFVSFFECLSVLGGNRFTVADLEVVDDVNNSVIFFSFPDHVFLFLLVPNSVFDKAILEWQSVQFQVV